MTAPLPPYGTAWCCAKCTSEDIDNTYRPTPLCLTWSGDGLTEITTHGGPVGDGECLLRTCQACGWAWLEVCADAAPMDESV